MQPAFQWLPRWWAAAVRLALVTLTLGIHPDGASAQSAGPLAGRDDLRHWHVAEHPGLLVISDAGAALTAGLAARVAALQEVFSGVWPAPKPPHRPAVVVAVRSGSTLRRWLSAPSPVSRHTRSAGAFVRGLDRDYLALALDADTGRPFGVLDHEFGHLLVDRHCERLPMWLDEGLAEVIANGLAGRDAADRATAIAQLLRLEPLMPLRDLLQAGRRDDVDSRETALFYAQAWTFVHYLLVADAGARAPRLATFMSQLMRGVGDLDAATSAFGDLKAVEAAWTRYVRTAAFAYIRTPLPRLRASRLTARPLAPHEAALLVGDFMAHAGDTEAAAATLSAAVGDKAGLASERLALAHLVVRDFPRAEQLAADAIRRWRRTPLAHYVRAVAVMAQSGTLTPAQLEQTEQDLRLAIEGAPQLARAYAVLGGLLAVARGRTDDGLALVRQATALDPSDFANRIALAQVLLLDGQHDEARWLANHIVQRAAVEEERVVGERLLRLAAQAAPKRAQRPGDTDPQ